MKHRRADLIGCAVWSIVTATLIGTTVTKLKK